MKYTAEQTLDYEQTAAKMVKAGWSERRISDELGLSRSWVHRHTKKSASSSKREAQESDTYTLISDELDTSDSSTSINTDSSNRIILTPKQKKYIEERKQRAVLYNDTTEGWMTTLSEAAYKAAGSVLWFTAIVYPESAPDGWKDRLDKTGIMWACSPKHDKDKWNHDSPAGDGLKDGKAYHFKKGELYKIGDVKKSHWHIVGKLDKPIKYKKLCALIQGITHGTLPQECYSLTSYFDYMVHLHEPDKYPYYKESRNEIHNNFSPEMNSAERKRAQMLIVATIHKQKITSWGRLMKEYGCNPEFLDIIAARHGFFNDIIKHEFYKAHKEVRADYESKQRDELIKQTKRVADELLKKRSFEMYGLILDDTTTDEGDKNNGK